MLFIYLPFVLHIIVFTAYFDCWVTRSVRIAYPIIAYLLSILGLLDMWRYIVSINDPIASSFAQLYMMLSIIVILMLPFLSIGRFSMEARVNPWKFKLGFKELRKSFLGTATIYFFYKIDPRSTTILLLLVYHAMFASLVILAGYTIMQGIIIEVSGVHSDPHNVLTLLYAMAIIVLIDVAVATIVTPRILAKKHSIKF